MAFNMSGIHHGLAEAEVADRRATRRTPDEIATAVAAEGIDADSVSLTSAAITAIIQAKLARALQEAEWAHLAEPQRRELVGKVIALMVARFAARIALISDAAAQGLARAELEKGRAATEAAVASGTLPWPQEGRCALL